MKKRLLAAAMVGALMLVGVGCIGKKATPPVNAPAPSAPAADQAAEKPIPEDVDSAVNDIIQSVQDETSLEEEVSDADLLDEIKSDTKELEEESYDL